MIIKRPDQPAVWEVFGRTMVQFRSMRSWMLLCVVGAGLFAFGGYCHRERLIQDAVFDLISAAKYPFQLARRVQAAPDSITIDIAHTDYQKLAFLRKIALDEGTLITGSDPYVSGKIRHDDKTISVDLRLKGDMLDHIKGEKWSFRVKVKGGDTLYGMKKFSLQSPATRNYLSEWLFHQAAARAGLIGMRYDFITLNLNGKDLGVYAVEEHFEKRLIENNQRREGPIVKFNESSWWSEKNQLVRNNVMYDQWLFDKERSESGYGSYYGLPVEVFGESNITSDPAKLSQMQVAANLLEAFRSGDLKASEVFEVEKFAKYIALTDLFGCHHSLHTNQYRFYYNPVTSRLEVIPFDVGAGGSTKLDKPACAVVASDFDRRTGHGKAIFLNTLFKDADFFAAYIEALDTVSDKSYLDELFGDLQDDIARNTAIIRAEFMNYQYSPEILYANQRYIKNLLSPPVAMGAYVQHGGDGKLVLDMGSVQMFAVEVLSVLYDGKVIVNAKQPIYLRGRLPKEQVDYSQVIFDMPDDWKWSAAEAGRYSLRYRLAGLGDEREAGVKPWSPNSLAVAKTDLLRRRANVDSFAFMNVEEESKTIRIAPGEWTIDKPMIIDAGYRVLCGAGTTLDLTNGGLIISHSPVTFVGEQESPIRILSSDSQGQGLVVLDAGEGSTLRYVQFDNLSNPSSGGWSLTGAVTFYQSPVSIDRCEFVNNRCEDGLNLIRSEFEIDRSLFAKTFADAFDADFCEGTIADSRFSNTGNDAVDVSGSVIEMNNVFVTNAGDKAVSAGENSVLIARNVTVNGANIGVASKDMSTVTLENVSIRGAKYALAAYQKKSEFAGGVIEASLVTLADINEQYLVDSRSSIVLDGVTVNADHEMARRVLLAMIGN